MQLVSGHNNKAYKGLHVIGILHVSSMQNIEGTIMYKNIFLHKMNNHT